MKRRAAAKPHVLCLGGFYFTRSSHPGDPVIGGWGIAPELAYVFACERDARAMQKRLKGFRTRVEPAPSPPIPKPRTSRVR